ncbi:MAG: DNA alkylation repair protein [Lentimicrobium sp.]|jgi:3-methyladenine DNA glycosylase AlkD|nr:DNA alkylation repair protein [Lentimicrobium sp.]
MDMDGNAYAHQLRRYFEAHSNMSLAPAMEKYMKNQFQFWGIKSPERKLLLRNFIAEKGAPTTETIDTVVRNLWQQPARELQYVAMELVARKKFLVEKDRITLIEWMLTHASWWDTVDYIACNVAGAWFKFHPEEIKPITTKWISSDNFWLQRSCLLFQLKYREATDLDLLFGFIERLAPEKEFFLRKAIGWALRELSKTNAKAVKMFVDSHNLSPLSRREAMKIITNK